MFRLTLAEQEFIDLGARSAIPILAQSSLLRPVAVRKSAGSVAFVDQELFGIDGQLDGCTASRREVHRHRQHQVAVSVGRSRVVCGVSLGQAVELLSTLRFAALRMEHRLRIAVCDLTPLEYQTQRRLKL